MTTWGKRPARALATFGFLLSGTAISAPAVAQIGFGGAAPVPGAPRASAPASQTLFAGPVDPAWGPLARMAGRRFSHTDKKGRIDWIYTWRWVEPGRTMEMVTQSPIHPNSSSDNSTATLMVDSALHAVVAVMQSGKINYWLPLGLTQNDVLIGIPGYDFGTRFTMTSDGNLIRQTYYTVKGVATDYSHPYHLTQVDASGQPIASGGGGVPGAPATAGDNGDDDALPGAPPSKAARDDDDALPGGSISPTIVQTTVDADGGTYKWKGMLGSGQTIDFSVRPETYARFAVTFCEKRPGGTQSCYLADKSYELERAGDAPVLLTYSYVSPAAGTQVQVSIVGYGRDTTKKVPYAVARMITPVTSDANWMAHFTPFVGKVWMLEAYDDALKVKMLYRYVPSADGKTLTAYARRADQPDKPFYTVALEADGIVRQIRPNEKTHLPVTFDFAGRPQFFFADMRTTLSLEPDGLRMTEASGGNLVSFAGSQGVVRFTAPDRIRTRAALTPQAVAEVIKAAPAEIAAQQRRLVKWGVLAKLAGTNWAAGTQVDSPFGNGSKLTMQRFVNFGWKVPGEVLFAQQVDPFGKVQHAMMIRLTEDGTFEQRVGDNGAPSVLTVSPATFSAPGRWRWSRDEASQALKVDDLAPDGSVAQHDSLGAITAAKYAELVSGQTATFNQQAAEYKAQQLAQQEAERKVNKGPSLFGALVGAAAGAVLTNGNADAMISGMKLGAGGQTAQEEMGRLQANGYNPSTTAGGVPGLGGGGTGGAAGNAAMVQQDYFSTSGSSACSMMNESNYRSVALSGNPDAQLKTMCGQAFDLYAQYKRALAQGYSAADADRTYQAHAQAAQNAISFYNSAR
jgi:hypothetical protein